jgi:cyclophilin family peptidyl-prolyl cis-trans isomerase
MKLIVFLFIIVLTTNNILAEENKMIMKLKNGSVEIELYPEIAPGHVKRFTELVEQKKYDGVVFHRVIDGFMAQTGDVKYGNSTNDNFNLSLAGTGGSDLPDLKAEFSDLAHTKGVLSAARSADPNSANSQFFIVLDAAPHLDRQYTAYGKVIKGMEFIEMIKKGDPQSGSVDDPDKIISITLKK